MSERPPMRWFRGFGCALAAVLGFAAVSSPLTARLPFPKVPVADQKINFLRAHRGDFDTVFVGSSRVHVQIIPGEFDQITGRHSYNVGLPGMTPPESLYLARQILAARLPRLKWMFFELTDLAPAMDPDNVHTIRGTYWHDARHTFIACHDLVLSRMPALRKVTLTWQHVQLFFERASNIGRGATIMTEGMLPPPKKLKGGNFADDGGFTPLPYSMTPIQRQRVQQGLDEMHSRAWPQTPLRPVYRDALREFIGEARRAGVEPIFFIAPAFTWHNQLAGPSDARLLNLSKEAEFPALFDPENFGDSVHLNAHGAEIFTRTLAEQFLAAQ